MQRHPGILLKQWRERRGLSQGGLALQAGVSQGTLSRWEAGTHLPGIQELEAVLRALRVSDAERMEVFRLLPASRAVHSLRALEGGGPPLCGDLLRAMRLRQGRTQEEVAQSIGVSQGRLARWERSEDWPPPERLHALCYTLHAHAKELEALTRGYFCPPDIETNAISLEEWELRRAHLDRALDSQTEALRDLNYLTIQAGLWPASSQKKQARFLLAHATLCHASILTCRDRFTEANRLIKRTEELCREFPGEDLRVGLSCTQARIAVHEGKSKAPHKGIAVLKEALNYTNMPNLQAWILSEIAEYLTLASLHDQAVAYSSQGRCYAKRMADAPTVYIYTVNHARYLLEGGRKMEALETLDAAPRAASTSIFFFVETHLRARIHLALSDRNQAHQWLQQTYMLIDRHDMGYMRPKLDLLAQKM